MGRQPTHEWMLLVLSIFISFEKKLQTKNCILAILYNNNYVLWPLKELAKEIGTSRAFVQTIEEDSADIVSVIRKAYEVFGSIIL